MPTEVDSLIRGAKRGGRLLGVAVFGSVSRFLIALGLALLLAGYTMGRGTTAGHVGIYGASAVGLGAVIRLIWFVRD